MKNDQDLFSIGEIAKALGVTRRIILHYEERGLIRPDGRDGATGNRYYTIDTFTQLRSIRSLQNLGLTLDEIRAGIETLKPVSGRNHLIHTDKWDILDDCYNANPVSMAASLDVLTNALGRKVAILGDMGELGDLTDQAHFNAGALAAMLGIDFVIAIGSKAARIADGAAMSGGDVVHFATKEEALPTVREQLRPNTSMLIKASHSMRFERLTEDLRKYYD